MSQQRFMIDLESTGLNKRVDDILQIAIVEINRVGLFWIPGKEFQMILHSSKQPKSEFAKTKMAALYAQANAAKHRWPQEIEVELRKFFSDCGSDDGLERVMVGKAASWFDLPFMDEHGLLHAPGVWTDAEGNDHAFGDFSHRVDDLSARLFLAQDLLGIDDRKALEKKAFDAYSELRMPEGTDHDALYDCYKQIRIMNGLNRLLQDRSPRSKG